MFVCKSNNDDTLSHKEACSMIQLWENNTHTQFYCKLIDMYGDVY
jgi:hypothetical protein